MLLPNRKAVCRLAVLLSFGVSVISADASDRTFFPADVKICSTKDPNYNTCFTDSANQMLKHLIPGFRTLNAVPIDPLNIPLISLAKNNSFVPTMGFNLTDVIYEGWTDAVVLRSEINPKDQEFNMVVQIPRYVMRSQYEVTGSIVGIPMEGSGNMTVIFYNVTNDMQWRGHQKSRNGENFLVIDDFSQKTKIDQADFNLSNVFNDTKRTEITNKLLNLNNRAVLDVGIAFLDHIWGRIHGGLTQKIFDNVPYRAMFPDLDSAPTAADVKICSTKDPNYNMCFTDSANQMLKHLIPGFRTLNAVPLDPLNIPLISIAKNNSFVPTLGFNFTDVIYEGWMDALVLRSEINPKDHEFNMVVKIPRYVMRCLYDVSGSIVGIPLEGSGNLTMIFYNVTNDMQLRGHQKGRNEENFLVIDDFSQKTKIDQVHFNLSNVFNDTKRTEITNRLLNLNNRAILDVGMGIIDHVWGRIHGGLMQKIFDNVPYRAMFPDLDSAPRAVDVEDEE